MGSVDKFGRKLESSIKKSETLRIHTKIRDGLLLDTDNHYNAQNKRIKLIHDPLEKQDVVNKLWVERNFLRFENDTVSLGTRRLTDLSDPTLRSDAVTLGILDRKITTVRETLEKEIKDRTDSLQAQLEEKLRVLSTDISSVNTVLRQSVKNIAAKEKEKVKEKEKEREKDKVKEKEKEK